jgi:hypothetical protein
LWSTTTTASTALKPVRLFPKRVQADSINQMELERLDGDTYSYDLVNRHDLPIKKKSRTFTPDEITRELNFMRGNLLCDPTLSLKLGAQVMCIVNREVPQTPETPTAYLCNGSQGVVVGFIIALDGERLTGVCCVVIR